MPESESQVSSRQRRANWVGLRTLRQLPKAVGETAEGESIYAIRSVRLLLHPVGANFVRLTECSRCGRELAGAPVLTGADLDRPLRPMICTDCIRKAGVSTMWESDGGEAAVSQPAPAVAAAPVVPAESQPAPAAVPAEAAEAPADVAAKPARLDLLEGHLRAVTDRVNELGRVARAHQADLKDRATAEEATADALRAELAAVQATTEDTRAEVRRLAAAGAGTGAGAGAPGEAVAGLARLIEEQRAELALVAANLAETQKGHAQLAMACQVLEGRLAEAVIRFGAGPVDLAAVEQLVDRRLAAAAPAADGPAPLDLETVEQLVDRRLAAAAADGPDLAEVEKLVAARLDEAEGRTATLLAGQRGELQKAVERSLAGLMRADEALAGGQAVLEERIEALAGQVAQASRRMEALLDRLDVLEAAAYRVDLPVDDAASAEEGRAGTGTLLDSLDRQLEAAARRLAARSQPGAAAGRTDA